MRTALYVHQLSVVTIQTTDPRDAKAVLLRYGDPLGEPVRGQHKLEPGIYLIVSVGLLDVTGVSGEVVSLRKDKDDWPDPKENIVALEPGATTSSIKDFFTVAKDLSFDD